MFICIHNKTRLVHSWSSEQSKKNTVSCNRIAVRQADTKQVGTHFFQVEKKVHDNATPDMLKKIYNQDFTESQHMANKEMIGAS